MDQTLSRVLTIGRFGVQGVQDVSWVAASKEQDVRVLFGWEVASEANSGRVAHGIEIVFSGPVEEMRHCGEGRVGVNREGEKGMGRRLLYGA